MVAHSHVDFPSDLATMLTAAGAVVVYCDTSGVRTSADLPVFFATAFGAPILLYELHIPCGPSNVARACSGAGGRKWFYGGIASGVKRLGACLRSCGDANSILQTFKVMPRSAPVRLCGYPWGSPQRGFCHLREAPRIVPFRRRASYPQALAVLAQMWASPFFGTLRCTAAPALLRLLFAPTLRPASHARCCSGTRMRTRPSTQASMSRCARTRDRSPSPRLLCAARLRRRSPTRSSRALTPGHVSLRPCVCSWRRRHRRARPSSRCESRWAIWARSQGSVPPAPAVPQPLPRTTFSQLASAVRINPHRDWAGRCPHLHRVLLTVKPKGTQII